MTMTDSPAQATPATATQGLPTTTPTTSHWAKYGRAYLVGFVFFVVTNAEAVDSIFGNMTAAELSNLTKRQLAVMTCQVLALAGTNVLAFLNQSVVRSGQPPPA